MNTATKFAAGVAAAGVGVAVGARAVRGANGGRDAAGRGRAYLRGVTVNRKPEEVYAFWRDLQNLRRVEDRIVRIDEIGEGRSRWVVAGPLGREVEFTAEIVVDEPGRVLAWRSEDGMVPHEGRVEFSPAPGGRGTELRVGLTYRPPAGALAHGVVKLTGDEPDRLVRDALRKIKMILEVGSILEVEEQPTGRGPVQEKVTQAIRHRVATGGRP